MMIWHHLRVCWPNKHPRLATIITHTFITLSFVPWRDDDDFIRVCIKTSQSSVQFTLYLGASFNTKNYFVHVKHRWTSGYKATAIDYISYEKINFENKPIFTWIQFQNRNFIQHNWRMLFTVHVRWLGGQKVIIYLVFWMKFTV